MVPLWAMPAVEGFSLTFPGLIQGGAVGLLFLMAYMIFTGKLHPASTVESIRKDREEAIARERANSDIWQKAYETSEASRREQEKALSDAIEALQTVEYLIRAIRAYGEERSRAVSVESERQDPNT